MESLVGHPEPQSPKLKLASPDWQVLVREMKDKERPGSRLSPS